MSDYVQQTAEPTGVVRPWQNTTGAAPILGTQRQLRKHGDFFFPEETDINVMDTLNKLYQSKERVHLCYGDTATGRDWKEIFGVTGYIGKTTGEVPIPILVYNKRCYGGCSILTDRVVKITSTAKIQPRLSGYAKLDAAGHIIYYIHPTYYMPPDSTFTDPLSRVKAFMQQLQV